MSLLPKYIEPHGGTIGYGPGGDRYLAKLTGNETGSAFMLSELELSPGAGPPLHRHTREDEMFIVLEGELTFWAGGQTLLAGPGSVVYGPRNIPHTFKNLTAHLTRAMVLITPPAAEGFFRAFGEPLPGSQGPPPDEVIAERIMKLAPEYGIEMLGPSPL